MRIAGKTSIDDLKKGDFNDLIYIEIPAGEEWKIRLTEELIEMKNGIMDVKILTSDEINEILTYIVTYFKINCIKPLCLKEISNNNNNNNQKIYLSKYWIHVVTMVTV